MVQQFNPDLPIGICLFPNQDKAANLLAGKASNKILKGKDIIKIACLVQQAGRIDMMENRLNQRKSDLELDITNFWL